MSLKPVKFSIRNRKVIISDEPVEKIESKPVEIHCVTSEFGKLTLKSKRALAHDVFDDAFSKFENEINQLNLGNKKTDVLMKIVRDLWDEQNKFILSIIDADTPDMPLELKSKLKECLNTTAGHINGKMGEVLTAYQRKKRRLQCPFYVQPKEIAMGLRWRTNNQPDRDIPNHTITQTTFQYVSIKEQLLSLFRNPSFTNIYFEYNNNQKHQCREKVYENYCCSTVYKKLGMAQHKNAVIVQLGIDDFDACSPVKSKATIHKMTAVYLQIRNMPPEFESRLDCIPLVALCETENTKHKDASLDNIFELIRNEFKELGTIGLQLNETTNLKVFLFNVSSDNLGANGAFGFVECFSMDGMCRICDMKKEEWRVATRENVSNLRTESAYQEAINYINSLADDEPIDYKISKGIKHHCLLNDIDYFHVLQNIGVDVMHDGLEGLIPYTIENIIKYLSDKKIISQASIQVLIRDFNYGFLFKRKLPSKIKITSSHLNQNATQLYTIMLHLPFILKEYKNRLGPVCKIITLLLQILQIMLSTSVRESDIKRLEMLIDEYLDLYKKVFKVDLKAKFHFATHYPSIYRQTGPVKQTWMMRFEAKHKMLASFAKGQCFKNIAYTIAERHQAIMCKNQFNVCMFEESKRDTILGSEFVDFLDSLSFDINRFYKLKFLNFAGYQYRKGLILMEQNCFYEISEILVSESSYSFICKQLQILGFDLFYNSVQIDPKNNGKPCYIKFDDLKNKQSYQKTHAKGNSYIIADTLNVYNFE